MQELVYDTVSAFEADGPALGQPASLLDLAHIGSVGSVMTLLRDKIDSAHKNETPETKTNLFLDALDSLWFYTNGGLPIPHDGLPNLTNVRTFTKLNVRSDIQGDCGFIAYFDATDFSYVSPSWQVTDRNGTKKLLDYIAMVNYFDSCNTHDSEWWGGRHTVDKIFIFDGRAHGGALGIAFPCGESAGLLGYLAGSPFSTATLHIDQTKFFGHFNDDIKSVYKGWDQSCFVLFNKTLLVSAILGNALTDTGSWFTPSEVQLALKETLKVKEFEMALGNLSVRAYTLARALPVAITFLSFFFWYHVRRIQYDLEIDQITWIGIDASGVVERAMVLMMSIACIVTPFLGVAPVFILYRAHIPRIAEIYQNLKSGIEFWTQGLLWLWWQYTDIVWGAVIGALCVLMSVGFIVIALKHLTDLRKQIKISKTSASQIEY